jgi:hypothetical protein
VMGGFGQAASGARQAGSGDNAVHCAGFNGFGTAHHHHRHLSLYCPYLLSVACIAVPDRRMKIIWRLQTEL